MSRKSKQHTTKAKKRPVYFFPRHRILSREDRMFIGISMYVCESGKTKSSLVKCLCQMYSICTSRCYQLEKEVVQLLNTPALILSPEAYESSMETKPVLVLDDNFEKRIILSLGSEGKLSHEGISRFFKEVLMRDVSPSKISGILKEYGVKADAVNDTLDKKAFPVIKAIGMDEIFQGRQPILTVVDLDTTYVLLIEPEKDRDAQTWEIQAEIMKDFGLDPETVISDACGSILVTIPKVFGEEAGQLDVFHAIKDISDVVFSFLRRTDSHINKEGELEYKVKCQTTYAKTKAKLAELQRQVAGEVEKADTIEVTYGFIVELLGFSGYSVEEVKELLHFFVNQLQNAFKDENCASCRHKERCQKCRNCQRCPECMKADAKKCMACPHNRGCQQCASCNRCEHPNVCKYRNENGKALKNFALFLENLPDTLKFLDVFFSKLALLDKELPGCREGLHAEVYALWRYKKYSKPWNDAFWELAASYGKPMVENVYANVVKLIKGSKRASSLVECLNSRIRPVINSKRRVTREQMNLLKLRINTKVYRRSRVEERVGKSPFELVTGGYLDFYELLEIKEPVIVEIPAMLAA